MEDVIELFSHRDNRASRIVPTFVVGDDILLGPNAGVSSPAWESQTA